MEEKSSPFIFEEKRFVNRIEESNLVTGALISMMSGNPPEQRTIAFVGERGIGKSWLLRHLYTIVRNDKTYTSVAASCWINLADFDKSEPVLAVLDILKEFRCCFTSNKEAIGATPAESSRRILEEAREYLKEHFLILFVDHVYESDWNLLAGLEDYLLGPLAIEPHTIIVMSGRGREYPWKTPELRLKATFINLKPLNEKDTEEQLRIQISPEAALRVKDIVAETGGNPLGNYLLGKESNPEDGLNAIIDTTLEVIADKGKRKSIRQYLEALCILRAFDEERIPPMLAAYFDNDEYKKWGYAQSRKVRDDLVQVAFARWNEQQHGFILDEMLRKSIESYMVTVKPDEWQRLENAAFKLYKAWSENFSRSKNIWLEEADYHKKALSSMQSRI